MHIKYVRMKNVNLPGGHLLENIRPGVLYKVHNKNKYGRRIIDDVDNDVLISYTCFKKFFKEIMES